MWGIGVRAGHGMNPEARHSVPVSRASWLTSVAAHVNRVISVGTMLAHCLLGNVCHA